MIPLPLGRVSIASVTLALVLLLNAHLRKAPLVAFATRIYYPPGDRRISLHQVYVANFDGSGRHRMSDGRRECEMVRWIGRDKLAWIEAQVSRREDTGTHADRLRPQNLILFDTRTRRKRIIVTGEVGPPCDWTTSCTWNRGEGLYAYGPFIRSTHEPEPREVLKLTADGIVHLPLEALLGKHRGPWRSSDGTAIALSEAVGPEMADRDQDLLLGKSIHRFKIDQEITGIWPSKAGSKVTYALAGMYAGSAGCDESIYRLDWTNNTATPIIEGLVQIDFKPDDPLYAGTTNWKNTADWGKKQVWACDLVAGDISTGRRWLLVKELSHPTSVSIQP